MTVKEIVKEYLINLEYTALFNTDGECACEWDDIAPCDSLCEDCKVGYMVDCANCRDYGGCQKRERWGEEYAFLAMAENCFKPALKDGGEQV